MKRKEYSLEVLTEMVKEILSANPKCLCSGSVALKLQDVNIMRSPKDIDIFLPFNLEFNIIEGMTISTNYDNDTYPDDGWDRKEYYYKGIQVDVFTPEDESFTIWDYVSAKGIKCVDKLDIIKFKTSHSFGDHFTRFKHRNDIIHMLIAN